MDYIIEISGFDPERDCHRAERKEIRAAGLYEAIRIANRWMERFVFAEDVSVYALPGYVFDCLASRRRRGAWEIVRKVKR